MSKFLSQMVILVGAFTVGLIGCAGQAIAIKAIFGADVHDNPWFLAILRGVLQGVFLVLVLLVVGVGAGHALTAA